MSRIFGIDHPPDSTNPIVEPRSLDPNVPWFFLKDDLPSSPLGNGWGPIPPLNPKEPSLPPIPEPPPIPRTLWPEAQNANEVVRQDFSAVRNFGWYRPSYLPSSGRVGSVAPLVPAGSILDNPLMTPGATWGAGYVGDANAPPIPFIPPAPQSTPGGIPGLLIETGLNDPTDPNTPLSGGLVGLIQEYLSEESRGSRERHD